MPKSLSTIYPKTRTRTLTLNKSAKPLSLTKTAPSLAKRPNITGYNNNNDKDTDIGLGNFTDFQVKEHVLVDTDTESPSSTPATARKLTFAGKKPSLTQQLKQTAKKRFPFTTTFSAAKKAKRKSTKSTEQKVINVHDKEDEESDSQTGMEDYLTHACKECAYDTRLMAKVTKEINKFVAKDSTKTYAGYPYVKSVKDRVKQTYNIWKSKKAYDGKLPTKAAILTTRFCDPKGHLNGSISNYLVKMGHLNLYQVTFNTKKSNATVSNDSAIHSVIFSLQKNINTINKKFEKKSFQNVGNAAPIDTDAIYKAIEDRINNKIDKTIQDVKKKMDSAVKANKKLLSSITSDLTAIQRRLDIIESILLRK
ncbi:hypothetical protein DL768_009622 [Monosporascus sp. mg162]|nr:hypothetical protein DL768_009622 [Monosporascus sp. mg162]